MLATDFYPSKKPESEKPVLVFLHGLLGSGDDWKEVLDLLEEYNRVTIDLPGHGKSKDIGSVGFDSVLGQVSEAVEKQLLNAGLDKSVPVVLIGYSLGARLLIYGLVHHSFDDLNVDNVLLEGGNFGLKSDTEKQQRLANDQRWAKRFAEEKMEQVLNDWYLQPVFSSLTSDQRQNLVKVRAKNTGSRIAEIMLSTSLAKQPYLLDKLKSINVPLHYICGEKDKKFFELAEQSRLSYSAVKGAGHNVHKEAPEPFAKLVRDQLGEATPTILERTNLE
ncbi:2-succinyl-6-hydroxy-2,4-cyclohexadiene-1-carboxylate synthase [Vibrio hannami]|uniref:2-succinyl-6-hydroxy-2, 4-cyclohexadiene-1-carboxylate synthase n=1 Tax=Vibrio hannami TaxID=2717094 RepID=UPI00240EACAC|nr:2-succinyl-6-hydroxy-2,4-cyclohexadiene-1-carboxylate synthase [Vibrio hannami]MDG3087561.1 2-succinyl-6-hydroxy-2,4-cyclohexadiene-1-carboxylate synthase [Vibrio hannami]